MKKTLTQVAQRFVSKQEAEYFAKLQIDTHLKKIPRTNPLRTAISDLESWAKNSNNKMELQVDKEASLLLNFNKLGPSLKIKKIHDELEKRAKKYGIAMVGVNNSHGFHTLNLWTDALGERDLIGICFFNGGPSGVIPFGGTKGIFGTNPLSFSIPTENKPVIADMATSEIPFFEIRNAKNEEKKLKENVAVDQQGELTTNPAEALYENNRVANLVSLGGGYKGYSLTYLIEILTASMIKSPLSTEMTPEYVSEEHGGLIIAFDISVFNKASAFKKSVQTMNKAIRSQKPKKGIEKITVPGDSSHLRLEKILEQGSINVDDELLEKLRALK